MPYRIVGVSWHPILHLHTGQVLIGLKWGYNNWEFTCVFRRQQLTVSDNFQQAQKGE